MAQFLFTLAEVTLTVSAVFVPLLLLERKLDRKFAPQWRYWAWLALALRLAVPLNVSLPQAPLTVTVPRVEVRREVPEAWGEMAGLPGPSAGGVQGGSAANTGYMPEPAADGRPDTASASAGTRTPERADGMTILFCLWLTGAAAVLSAHGVSYWSFQRTVRRWRRQELVWKGMAVYRCPKISSPLLMGFFRPCVLLPEGLEGEAVEFALHHEEIHRRRGDLWYKLLLLWGCALHWFNPLVWVLRRTTERDIEISCDGLLLKGRDENYRRSYGAALLTTVTAGRQRGTALTSSFSGSGKSLKQRFRSLVDTSPKAKGRAALAVLCAAALLGGGLVACREDSLLDRLHLEERYLGMIITTERVTGNGTRTGDIELTTANFSIKSQFSELRDGESPEDLYYELELSPPLAEIFGVQRLHGQWQAGEQPSIHFSMGNNVLTAEEISAAFQKDDACTLWVTDSNNREKSYPVKSYSPLDGTYYVLGSADFWWNNRDGDGTRLHFRMTEVDPETMAVLATDRYVATVTWPLAEDVLLLHEDGKPFDNFGETGTPLENFLMYPTYMSYYPYIAELVVENGEIVSMTWKKGRMESNTEMVPEIFMELEGTIIRGDSITIGHGRLIDYDLEKGTITIQEGDFSYPSPREFTHLEEEYRTLQLAFPVPTALSIGLYWQGGEDLEDFLSWPQRHDVPLALRYCLNGEGVVTLLSWQELGDQDNRTFYAQSVSYLPEENTLTFDPIEVNTSDMTFENFAEGERKILPISPQITLNRGEAGVGMEFSGLEEFLSLRYLSSLSTPGLKITVEGGEVTALEWIRLTPEGGEPYEP